jgi:GDP-4-dehydro-6-deoxy-D-mannose reductase
LKVVITGATGFVGGWLQRELAAAGHVVQAAPPSKQLDVADAPSLTRFLADAAPDAVAHLAAVANAPAADGDPADAVRTNIGGTIALVEAARAQERPPCLLVVSSADVYGTPRPSELPLSEFAPIAPRHIYALTKAGQEAAAIAGAARYGLQVTVVRPFNHAGPGQPPVGAVAAFAARIAAVQRGVSSELSVGNLDVERDIGDVRDFVRAYRLLLEGMAAGRIASSPAIFNVATGSATSLRWVVEELCRLADVSPRIVVQPRLVREDDPPRIVGDARALREAVGWQPQIALTQTLAEMLGRETRLPAHQPA